jgi:peptidyl-prolyl cis-trans isomerase A (cyclophilin A)
MTQIVLRIATVLAACAGLASAVAARDPLQASASGEVMVPMVRIETPSGNIDAAVDTVHAPITANNFLKYVDAGMYDAGRFWRSTRPDNYVPHLPDRPPFQIIQADINAARAKDRFPPIPLERTTKTGLTHKAGTLSMPRGADADSATAGFVICLEDTPSLDFGSMRYPDGQGFAAFGHVVKGMDVVGRIHSEPVNGQNLTPPIPITKIVRLHAAGR